MPEWFVALLIYLFITAIVGFVIYKRLKTKRLEHMIWQAQRTFEESTLIVDPVNKPGHYKISGWGGDAYFRLNSGSSSELELHPYFCSEVHILVMESGTQHSLLLHEHGRKYFMKPKSNIGHLFLRAKGALNGQLAPIRRSGI